MKILLLRDVPKLGRQGDVKEVADGYARNYLIPRGLAQPATGALQRVARGRAQATTARADREIREARETAARLDGFSLTIRARVGEKGRLFGSVTNQDVARGLAEIAGVRVDRRRVALDEAIKTPGVYRIPVRLHPDVQAVVEVRVEGEDGRGEEV
ncbi:MAG: 50S ribosomal protein L9 [bacterium]|nr:50S ribosomal protein L9 [bacterium]